jgi:hypothetical protein
VSKPRRILLFATGGFVCATVALLLLRTGADSEPIYKGRTLTEWVEMACTGTAPNYTTQEAADAITAIGTNALPTFLTWLRYEQSPAKRWGDRTYLPFAVGEAEA